MRCLIELASALVELLVKIAVTFFVLMLIAALGACVAVSWIKRKWSWSCRFIQM